MHGHKITICLVVVVLVLLYIQGRTEWFEVASKVDQRAYPVLGGYSDMADAADKLAQLNSKNQRLIKYMTEKYRDPTSHGYVLAMRLQKRYRGDRLRENDPPDKNNTSYTQDKGDITALCLREKVTGNNRLHDHSILEFVDLHELAHIASEGYGHDDEFWSNFAFLLRDAKAAGIHRPVDYSQRPVNYCGLDVGYNPYYDLDQN